jgi:hypothetical protein
MKFDGVNLRTNPLNASYQLLFFFFEIMESSTIYVAQTSVKFGSDNRALFAIGPKLAAPLFDQVSHQAGPARLMTRAQALPCVSMVVLVE